MNSQTIIHKPVVPQWQKLVPKEGILLEPVPDDHRFALWLPPDPQQESHSWERIASVADSQITQEEGICTIQVTSIRAQPQSLLGKVWRRFLRRLGAQVWILPNGE